MQAFVVNLERFQSQFVLKLSAAGCCRSTDRWQHMQLRAEQFSQPSRLRRLPGVDGTNRQQLEALGKEPWAASMYAAFARPENVGDLGCALSHR